MRQKSDRLSQLLYVTVIGLFVAAVVVGLATRSSERVVGVLLIAVGAGAIAFARSLTLAQQQLAERPYIPAHWKEVRPLTFVLWGSGVLLCGVLQVFLW